MKYPINTVHQQLLKSVHFDAEVFKI